MTLIIFFEHTMNVLAPFEVCSSQYNKMWWLFHFFYQAGNNFGLIQKLVRLENDLWASPRVRDS